MFALSGSAAAVRSYRLSPGRPGQVTALVQSSSCPCGHRHTRVSRREPGPPLPPASDGAARRWRDAALLAGWERAAFARSRARSLAMKWFLLCQNKKVGIFSMASSVLPGRAVSRSALQESRFHQTFANGSRWWGACARGRWVPPGLPVPRGPQCPALLSPAVAPLHPVLRLGRERRPQTRR